MVAHTAWTLVISVLAGAIGLTEGVRSVPGLAIVPAHVVSSWTVTARVQCHTLCLYSPYCVSVNWRWKANPALCDLNKVTESDVPNAVRSDDDSVYIELSAEELSGRVCRCQSSETCVPVRHQGYLCLTPEKEGTTSTTTTTTEEEKSTSVPTTTTEEERSTSATTTTTEEERSTSATTTTTEEERSTSATTTTTEEERSTSATTTTTEEERSTSATTTTIGEERSTSATTTTTEEEGTTSAPTTTTEEERSSSAPTTVTEEETSSAPTTVTEEETSSAPTTVTEEETSSAPTTVTEEETSSAPTTVTEENTTSERGCSSDFKLFKSSHLGQHSKRIGFVTIKECLKACLKETSFLCRSVDIYPQIRQCALNSITKDDVSTGFRSRNVASHYERICHL